MHLINKSEVLTFADVFPSNFTAVIESHPQNSKQVNRRHLFFVHSLTFTVEHVYVIDNFLYNIPFVLSKAKVCKKKSMCRRHTNTVTHSSRKGYEGEGVNIFMKYSSRCIYL